LEGVFAAGPMAGSGKKRSIIVIDIIFWNAVSAFIMSKVRIRK
jgi:hypothetical protein